MSDAEIITKARALCVVANNPYVNPPSDVIFDIIVLLPKLADLAEQRHAEGSKREQDWEKWKQQINAYEEMLKAKDARIAELEEEMGRR